MAGVPSSLHESIVIVGAGVFGLSTALALKERGYSDITILDRELPPVRDGSSTDISRIIRSDYLDPFYSRLATEAIESWKSSNLFKPHYHPSGYMLTTEVKEDIYLEKNKEILRGQKQTYRELNDVAALKQMIPGEDLKDLKYGYVNTNAGWADAAGAIRALATHLAGLGVSFITGPRGTLQSLIVDDTGKKVLGVNVAQGSPIHASRVILATGAWTARYLDDLDYHITGSAQPLGFIQLTPEEGRRLANIPVSINTTSGVFLFPPSPGDNLLKVAYHGHGFEIETSAAHGDTGKDGVNLRVISVPQRDANNAASKFFPEDADKYLRAGLRQLIPSIADRPWVKTRLCWYTETPKGDFIADYHHTLSGLFIATGGSGHGFKFLPVLGRYIADCFERTAVSDVRQRWKLPKPSPQKEKLQVNDGSRRGPPRRMLRREEQLRANL
ncbi:FAD dependent oxidoreductase [Exophiala viscosa]|uniref:FAD dependent oxidoreductase n=1 Tax=Exophiala viscosa TaxID=2486360 RepID=UPI0021A13DF9|nr:FAD dependent oxidoreductase [Exophiala viscosa]